MATVSLNLERHVKASWSRIKAGGASDRESVVMLLREFQHWRKFQRWWLC
jgi:hypothetical protein